MLLETLHLGLSRVGSVNRGVWSWIRYRTCFAVHPLASPCFFMLTLNGIFDLPTIEIVSSTIIIVHRCCIALGSDIDIQHWEWRVLPGAHYIPRVGLECSDRGVGPGYGGTSVPSGNSVRVCKHPYANPA